MYSIHVVSYLVSVAISAILIFSLKYKGEEAWAALGIAALLSLVPALGLYLCKTDHTVLLYLTSIVCLIFWWGFAIALICQGVAHIYPGPFLVGLLWIAITFIVANYLSKEIGHFFPVSCCIGGYLFIYFLIVFVSNMGSGRGI